MQSFPRIGLTHATQNMLKFHSASYRRALRCWKRFRVSKSFNPPVGVGNTSRIDFEDFVKVMDYMQESSIAQTRKQAGFTDEEVNAP